jgi:hypothetical protein
MGTINHRIHGKTKMSRLFEQGNKKNMAEGEGNVRPVELLGGLKNLEQES